MTDTYTPKEFARSCKLRGYCAEKRALAWLQEQGIEEPTEDDLIRCYYACNESLILPHRRPYIAMRTDGQNMVAPEHASNSRGMSYAQQMRRIQAENDRSDARILRQKMEGANELD